MKLIFAAGLLFQLNCDVYKAQHFDMRYTTDLPFHTVYSHLLSVALLTTDKETSFSAPLDTEAYIII